MNCVSFKQILISGVAIALAISSVPIAQAAPATLPAQQGGSVSIFLPTAMRSYPTETIFGVGMNTVNESDGLSKLVDAGIQWTRTPGVVWSDVEKTEGTYDWSAASIAALDANLIAAKQNGLKAILLATGTPVWAQKTKFTAATCGPIAQAKFGAFAKFMQQVVTRYSAAPYGVEYFEVWNEPDGPIANSPPGWGCWGDVNDAYYGGAYFGNMLAVVYPAMKQVNPSIKVLNGGLLMDCNGTDPQCTAEQKKSSLFFEGMLRSSGKASYDILNFHGYDYFDTIGGVGKYSHPNWNTTNIDGPVGIAKAKFLRAKMAQYGVSKPLMNSETALLQLGCQGNSFQNFETTKSYYMPVTYAAAMAEGFIANVWFDAAGGWECTGITYPAHPKALVAFKVARQKLAGSQFIREVPGLPSGMRAYEFSNGGKLVWVIWSLDGTARNVTPALGTPARVYGTDGRSIAPTATISIGMEPFYLEFGP